MSSFIRTLNFGGERLPSQQTIVCNLVGLKWVSSRLLLHCWELRWMIFIRCWGNEMTAASRRKVKGPFSAFVITNSVFEFSSQVGNFPSRKTTDLSWYMTCTIRQVKRTLFTEIRKITRLENATIINENFKERADSRRREDNPRRTQLKWQLL